ncbi:hypothetical protein D3C72_1237810 [compost metagenome]
MLLGQCRQIHIGREPVWVADQAVPQAQPLRGVGHREIDHRLKATGECLVDIGAQVGRQDHGAGKVLHALEQIGHFLVGMAVVAALRGRALAEQRVGLVEKQDPAAALCLVEHRGKVLLGLADVLGHHHRQVDAVHVHRGVLSQQRGGERLAGAGRPIEQAAIAGLDRLAQPPGIHQRRPLTQPGADDVDFVHHIGR